MQRFRLARFMLMLAIVAVVARSIIPAGYMPEMGNNKIFHMTICTMDGPKTVAVNDNYQPHSKLPHVAKEICAFSLLNHSPFNEQNSTVSFAAPAFVGVLQKLVASDQFVRTHVFYSAAEPRAPPVIV